MLPQLGLLRQKEWHEFRDNIAYIVHCSLAGARVRVFPVSQNKTEMARYFSRQVFDAQPDNLSLIPRSHSRMEHMP